MKITVTLTKLIPIILNLYLLVAIMGQFLCFETYEYNVLFGHSSVLDLYMLNLSKRFRFCSWHRVLIMNLLVISLIQYGILLFPENVDIHTALTIMGGLWIVSAITSTILYFKYGCCKIEESK